VAEEIDLLDAAGGAVAKRAFPAIAALFLVALIVRRLRAGRKARRRVRRELNELSAPNSTTVLLKADQTALMSNSARPERIA
jgi:hypothetical protein